MSAEPGPKAVKAPPAARTKIGRAVLKNSAEIDLIGVSVIALIDSKIDSLRQEQERLNSDESRAAIDRAILDGRTSNVRSKRSVRRHRNLPLFISAKALSPRKRILWLREFVIGGPNDTFKFAIRCSTKYSKQTTSAIGAVSRHVLAGRRGTQSVGCYFRHLVRREGCRRRDQGYIDAGGAQQSARPAQQKGRR